MKRRGKGPEDDLENIYLGMLSYDFASLFVLLYGLNLFNCKLDVQGQHVYKPRETKGPDVKCEECMLCLLRLSRANLA